MSFGTAVRIHSRSHVRQIVDWGTAICDQVQNLDKGKIFENKTTQSCVLYHLAPNNNVQVVEFVLAYPRPMDSWHSQ